MKKENKKILVSITTTQKSDWRKKIEEVKELGLDEVAAFPTCLNKKDREEFYKLIKESGIKNIPLVHLRSDMDIDEMDYFIENYNTKVFCTHTQREYSFSHDLSKYHNIMGIENVYYSFDEEEIKKFGGICLDFSHLENAKISAREIFEHNVKTLEKYPVIANHINSIKKTPHIDENGYSRYDNHFLNDLSEFDYLKNYPENYFSPYIAIELENSIKEQLKARDYLNNLINK
jgi:hypothetical protein